MTESKVGFNHDEAEAQVPERNKLTSSMSHELLRRFRDEIIMIPRMSKSDYAELVGEVSNKLPVHLKDEFAALCRERLADAIARDLGMRFFEETLSKVLMEDQLTNPFANKVRKVKQQTHIEKW